MAKYMINAKYFLNLKKQISVVGRNAESHKEKGPQSNTQNRNIITVIKPQIKSFELLLTPKIDHVTTLVTYVSSMLL